MSGLVIQPYIKPILTKKPQHRNSAEAFILVVGPQGLVPRTKEL
jgi:hypothetical protein